MSALKRNMLSLFTLQGAAYLLPLIAVPYLVRVLGPTTYGRIAFAQAFVQYFVLLTDYGFNLSATRSIALSKGDPQALSRIFSSVLAAKLCLAAAGWGVLQLACLASPNLARDYPLFVVCYLAVLGNALFPVWLFQGIERMGYITAFSISARAVTVLGLFVLIRSPDDMMRATALLSAPALLSAVLALPLVPRIAGIRLVWPSLAHMREAFVQGWHIFTATFGGALYNNSNTFFLGLVAPPAAVGYFAAADKLIRAVQGLISPISEAAYPHVAVLATTSREAAFGFVGKLLGVLCAGAILAGMILYLAAGPVVGIALGSAFAPAAQILQTLAPWPLLIALNVVFGALFVVQLGLGRLLTVSIVLPGLVHIALLYPIAKHLGPVGVAWFMLFTEASVLLIRMLGTSRSHPVELRAMRRGLLSLVANIRHA